MNDKNIDDEFERIIAGFSDDSAPDPLELKKSRHEDAAGDADSNAKADSGAAGTPASEATDDSSQAPEAKDQRAGGEPDVQRAAGRTADADQTPADGDAQQTRESSDADALQPNDAVTGTDMPAMNGADAADLQASDVPDEMSAAEEAIDKAVDKLAEELNGEMDEELHLEGGKRSIGLVFAPLRPAEGVARMLGMYGLARWIVPIADQVVLYLELDDDVDSEDAEFESLLGDDRPMPEEVDRFARVMSKLSRFGAVAVVSNLQEDDSTIAGDIIARRYVDGEPEDQIPGGLLINSIDSRAEDLLLGRTHPSDYPDAVHPKERPRPNKRGFGRPFGLR